MSCLCGGIAGPVAARREDLVRDEAARLDRGRQEVVDPPCGVPAAARLDQHVRGTEGSRAPHSPARGRGDRDERPGPCRDADVALRRDQDDGRRWAVEDRGAGSQRPEVVIAGGDRGRSLEDQHEYLLRVAGTGERSPRCQAAHLERDPGPAGVRGRDCLDHAGFVSPGRPKQGGRSAGPQVAGHRTGGAELARTRSATGRRMTSALAPAASSPRPMRSTSHSTAQRPIVAVCCATV